MTGQVAKLLVERGGDVTDERARKLGQIGFIET